MKVMSSFTDSNVFMTSSVLPKVDILKVSGVQTTPESFDLSEESHTG